MSSILFYSNECKISKSLIAKIKLNKLESYFVMKLIEEIEIEEILIYGIESVPTIINNGFYYEKEECDEFINGLIQYIKYSHVANLIVTSEIKTQHDDDDKCAICMGTFEIGQTIHTFFCTHKFHKDCSVIWRKTKNSCPICNKIIK